MRSSSTQAKGARVSAMTEADVDAVARIDPDAHATSAQLREEIARPWSRLWVARDDRGVVTAFLVAWHVADELHVLNVATAADRRRRGYGRALVAACVSYAKEERLRHVLLEVRRSNAPAIALYRGAGFFAMGLRARYYPDDEDAIEMVLLLDPESGEIVPHDDEVKLEPSG
jgi:ribosomal-protein-alanine N-acetyltransferase